MDKKTLNQLKDVCKELEPLQLKKPVVAYTRVLGKNIEGARPGEYEPDMVYRIRTHTSEPWNPLDYLKELYNEGGMDKVYEYRDFLFKRQMQKLEPYFPKVEKQGWFGKFIDRTLNAFENLNKKFA